MYADIRKPALNVGTCRFYRIGRHRFKAEQPAAAARPHDAFAIGEKGQDIVVADIRGVCLGVVLSNHPLRNGVVTVNAEPSGTYPDNARPLFGEGIYYLLLQPGRLVGIQHKLPAALRIAVFSRSYLDNAISTGSQVNTAVAVFHNAVNRCKHQGRFFAKIAREVADGPVIGREQVDAVSVRAHPYGTIRPFMKRQHGIVAQPVFCRNLPDAPAPGVKNIDSSAFGADQDVVFPGNQYAAHNGIGKLFR
ncbi:hypothetical protein DSECCO2_474380 [anaerobic digester metagenome]